jgi:REP element-mobilizing transposase RayT
MSEYRKTTPGNLYFVTLTVEGWIDIFNRPLYNDILIDNLRYCQEKEGLEIYEYVLMSSHLHMIAARTGNGKDLTELLARFKSVTAKKILNLININPKESRKEWLLYLFNYFANLNKQYSQFHFWQYTQHPEELFSSAIIDQKAEYIRNNPVTAGIVAEPEYYLYSSACPHSPLKTLPL